MTDIEKLRELLAATEGLKNLQAKTYPEGDAGPRDRWIEAESIASVYNAADYLDESDAALIVAAVNALPALLDEVERLREALNFYADEYNYIDAVAPLDLSQETRNLPARIGADGGRRAQAALSGKRTFLSPTEAAGEKRVREVVPQLINQLRDDASKMKHGPERIHVLAASNWLGSLLARAAKET